jgi:hypothetical protein
MSSFMLDIATVHKILHSLYDYMDERRRWQEQAVVKVCVEGWRGAVHRQLCRDFATRLAPT